MPALLSLEHSARITTLDEPQRTLYRSRKTATRRRIACFIGLNAAAWAVLLALVLFR